MAYYPDLTPFQEFLQKISYRPLFKEHYISQYERYLCMTAAEHAKFMDTVMRLLASTFEFIRYGLLGFGIGGITAIILLYTLPFLFAVLTFPILKVCHKHDRSFWELRAYYTNGGRLGKNDDYFGLKAMTVIMFAAGIYVGVIEAAARWVSW